MSPLAARLSEVIAREGPMTVARYMALCLGDPDHGYYATRRPIGAAGDFVTAPEISQMFGELIGLWCAVTWQQMGAPERVNLVELGPGRGTLMADALRAAHQAPGFPPALHVSLVETSATLRAQQREALGTDITWCESFDDVPAGPLLIVANEFFDALPVHQYARTADGWRERLVGLNGADRELRFVLADNPTEVAWDAAPGEILEVAPEREQLVESVARRIARDGGAGLIIDYGHLRSAPGDTLQAVRDHRPHPVLMDPGLADLTTHVDFEALAKAATKAGAATHGPVTQSRFLTALGIEARAASLLRNAGAEQADAIESGLRRLTAPDQMGELFKVLAITHPDLPVPAGFEGAP